ARARAPRARCAVVRVVASGLPLLGLDFVPAELVAEGGQHLGSVRVVLARAEPGQERERDDRGGGVGGGPFLDGPATLTRIGDEALDVLKVSAVGTERPPGKLQ